MPVPDGAFLNLACSTCEQVQRTARTGNLCALSSSASCCDAILWRLLHRVLFVVCLAFLSVSLGLVLFSLSPIICFRVLCFGLSFVFFLSCFVSSFPSLCFLRVPLSPLCRIHLSPQARGIFLPLVGISWLIVLVFDSSGFRRRGYKYMSSKRKKKKKNTAVGSFLGTIIEGKKCGRTLVAIKSESGVP